ncbi:MAG: UbiX family flavin prenyltransferase [Syntrophobacteraceae bacterium]|jgi:4-hydroxy-3-polyprenylbenzoate decarboxylase|nr:UbiX family flavin prenyltransferase [Syntrophobacteraceae bacterium]
MSDASRRIVVGITGASGVIYGIELLRVLGELNYETHLIVTEAARRNILIETDIPVEEVEKIATRVYRDDDLAAPVASGSFITGGMVVIPCTVKSLSAIAHSFTASLLVRAADVCLKERRPLVLVVRETPLHSGHLRLMLEAASLGAVILPPIPAFYHRPETIQDLVHQTLGKVLDCFHIPHDLFQRWH